MKKIKIAVYSQKGGVGKTPISRTLATDLNSDKYIRTDYRVPLDYKNFIQLFPKIEEYDNEIPKTNLSVVYDLCTYTKFDKINNIINDIDLFIIPAQAHELDGAFHTVTLNSIEKIYKYCKPIIILSYGTYSNNKRQDLNKFKSKLNNYNNIHFIYLPHSEIYYDNYTYDKDFLLKPLSLINRYELDTKAKSLLEIYNTSKRTKYLFNNIHKEYLKLLLIINNLFEKDK